MSLTCLDRDDARHAIGAGFTLLLIGLVVSGCDRDDGAHAVGSLSPGAPVGIEDRPYLVAGEDPQDPMHMFYRVVTPFVLEDGHLVVPLAGENEIRVFDRGGALVATYGGQGEGPGEFLGLSAAWNDGDVIEVFDGRQLRVTRFDLSGEAEVVRIEAVPSAQAALPVLDDGSRILHGVKEVSPSGRDRMAVHHFDRSGDHREELVEFFGMRRYEFSGGTGPDPLSPRGLVRTHAGEVFVAETTEPTIEVIDLSTGTRRSIEWDAERTMFAGDPAAAAREAALGAARSEEERERIEARFDALTGDEAVSVFWDFVVDAKGFIWIRPFDPTEHAVDVGGMTGPGPGGKWIVLSPEGEEVADLVVPQGLVVSAITTDAVVGIRRDELGVESVRVHRLERYDGGDL